MKLSKSGMSWRAIARALGISRNTVREILGKHEQAREQPHTVLPARRSREKASKLDLFREHIDRLLERYPDITAQRVFEILRGEKGYDGGYWDGEGAGARASPQAGTHAQLADAAAATRRVRRMRLVSVPR